MAAFDIANNSASVEDVVTDRILLALQSIAALPSMMTVLYDKYLVCRSLAYVASE